MLLLEKMTLERREGRLEGEKLGLRRGKREGRLEGKLEGEREKSWQIARNMLAEGLDVRIITKVTGLTEAEIEGLRQ